MRIYLNAIYFIAKVRKSPGPNMELKRSFQKNTVSHIGFRTKGNVISQNQWKYSSKSQSNLHWPFSVRIFPVSAFTKCYFAACCRYPSKTICMKCQILFPGKNKNNISICRLLKILPSVLSVQIMDINWLIVLAFNDTSTLMGHFVSSPREREKRDRREMRWNRGIGEKEENEWKWRNRS